MIRYLIITLISSLVISQNKPALLVQSTAFANKNYIPYRYTCDAENVNPELKISNVPSSAASLALIMLDSSAAFGEFDHWIVWNIPTSGHIKENSVPGVIGRNSRKENKYIGPCPPNGVHEYRFRVYALDVRLELPDSSGKNTLLKAIRGHILASGELLGRFQRQ